MVAFGGLIGVLIADPAPAVAGNLVTHALECRAHLRATFERHANAEHRQRQRAPFKLTQDAPHARARAVFVNAFHAQMPRRKCRRVEHLRQKLLAAGVAMQHAVLAALFVVEHELHGHARVARPLRMGRVCAVAGEITRVV